MRLRSTREVRTHGCGGSGGVLPLRRSFHHRTAKAAATAMAAVSTNGVRLLPPPLGGIEFGGIECGGTTNSKVRVTDCPWESVAVTADRKVPAVPNGVARVVAALCP